MTGITGIWESSRKAVRYATTWTLEEVIDKVPNATCARILRTALAGVTPGGEPLICPQPITPDARATFALCENAEDRSKAPNLGVVDSDSFTRDDAHSGPPDSLQWALLLPITSRGTSCPKAFWERVETTFEKLLQSVEASRSVHTAVYIAFDHNDPVLDAPEALSRLKVLHAFTLPSCP